MICNMGGGELHQDCDLSASHSTLSSVLAPDAADAPSTSRGMVLPACAR